VGVGLMSARSSYLNSCSQGEFILGYAELDEMQIQEGISRLAKRVFEKSYSARVFYDLGYR
jgi:GntR family transcriptional regulator / MocR family aminotransferase